MAKNIEKESILDLVKRGINPALQIDGGGGEMGCIEMPCLSF